MPVSESLNGIVVSMLGPYVLPSDGEKYIVFGFQAPKSEKESYNGVFYPL